jgi:hypothetical protein
MKFQNLPKIFDRMHMLNSMKNEFKQNRKDVLSKTETEKRHEERTNMKIPLVPLLGRRKLKAYIVNYSQGGLGICADKRIALSVGNVFDILVNGKTGRVETRWVNDVANSSFTTAGFQIIDGNLDLKGAEEDKNVGG